MKKSVQNILFALSVTILCSVLLIPHPQKVFADGLRIEKRVESRSGRRNDRRENVGDGVEDRQEFREGRRESIGEGPESRIENRQDKRGNRGERAVDRVEDRGKRLNRRF